MFCRNCGSPVYDEADVCRNCGISVGAGENYCPRCGYPVTPEQSFCQNCGCNIGAKRGFDRNFDREYDRNYGGGFDGGYDRNREYDRGFNGGYANYNPVGQYKSKIAAGLLGIFVGGLGVHNFYLGYTTKAIIQILASVVGGIITCGISSAVVSIWGLVEGILILCDVINVDGNGNPLRE